MEKEEENDERAREVTGFSQSSPDRTHGDTIKSFAATRSHQDSQSSHSAAIETSRSLLLLNGGAAVATLAFYSDRFRDFSPWQGIIFLTGEVFYFIGALLVVNGMDLFGEAVREWSMRWQHVAFGQEKYRFWRKEGFDDFAHTKMETARKLNRWSIRSFIFGTLAVGVALFISLSIR